MSAAAEIEPTNAPKVSSLELFFDLVFVFCVSQVTSLLDHATGPSDYGRTALVLGAVWYMYNGYSWLTSNDGVRTAGHQLLIFVAMAGFLLMGVTLPTVFAGGGIVFGIGYVTLVLIHGGLYFGRRTEKTRGIVKVLPFNFSAAVLILAAGFVDPHWRWALWLAAIVLELIPMVTRVSTGLTVSVPHFVERHGLIIIIALGEGIIRVGDGAHEGHLALPVVAMILLALALIASLWWSYFARDTNAAEESLHSAPEEKRMTMILSGLSFAHLPMVAGIVLIAAGLEVLIAHPLATPDARPVWHLASGLCIYLLGDVWFRRAVKIGRGWVRLAAAALAIASAPLGIATSGLTQLAALVTLLLAALGLEALRRR